VKFEHVFRAMLNATARADDFTSSPFQNGDDAKDRDKPEWILEGC